MSETFDVLIVGAGLSGIGAARHLQRECPGKTFALLEARESVGGTWDLFRYPGIRSDSDMFTLGYAFKPWPSNKVIADGGDILAYVKETAQEGNLEQHLRLGHKAIKAAWHSDRARWTVTIKVTRPGGNGDRVDADGETVEMSARFLMMCSGYYDYAQGHSPEFEGRASFGGVVVHPQFWPEDLDYEGKRVVVIGSGATAITLVPALAKKAAHVTMLQRSPTYIMSLPDLDHASDVMKTFLPKALVQRWARSRRITLGSTFYKLCRKYPRAARRLLLGLAKAQLGRHIDMTHFTPSYRPWEQRLCVAPNGDIFRAVRKGEVDIVTDTIDRFTPKGIRLASGRELDADIVVTATGLNLQLFGGMAIEVDGAPVRMNDHYIYKGMMFDDVPNFSLTMGYTNASWTLKADLIAQYVCRLLQHMDQTKTEVAVPRTHGRAPAPSPFVDLSSGYFKRAMGTLPKGSSEVPWALYNDYAKDRVQLLDGAVTDSVMEFTTRNGRVVKSEERAAPRA